MKRFLRAIKISLLDKKLMLILLGGIIGLLSYYIIYIIEDMDLTAIEDIIQAWPEGMIEFFGDIELVTNPYGFWGLELLSFIWLYGGIYIIFMAAGLLSQEVEEKTIDLSLSKPVTRDQFLGSKIAFLYIFIMASMGIFFLITMVSMTFSSVFQEEGLYFDRLWLTYIMVVIFLGALAMFAMFFSTIFLNTRKSMALGVIVLFLMFFLGDFYIYMDEAVQDIKYISVFYYFNPSDYLTNPEFEIYILDFIILYFINAILIFGSLIIFDKKDIPI